MSKEYIYHYHAEFRNRLNSVSQYEDHSGIIELPYRVIGVKSYKRLIEKLSIGSQKLVIFKSLSYLGETDV